MDPRRFVSAVYPNHAMHPAGCAEPMERTMLRFHSAFMMLAGLTLAVPAAAAPSCDAAASCVSAPQLKRAATAVKQDAMRAVEAPAAVRRAASGPAFGFVIEAAGEIGGDPFATIEFEDGTTQDVETGRGLTVAVGGKVRPSAESPFAVRGTVGFKYVTTMADNVDITLTRVPIEVVGMVDLPRDLWIGAGFVRHSMVKFRGGGLGPDVDLDDANGATAEFGWRWVALTYTAMRYTDEAGAEYDASVFGLSLTHTFKR